MAGSSLSSSLWISTILLLSVILQACSAHRIDVDPGKKECFFEDLHHEDQVYVYSTCLQHLTDGVARFFPDDSHVSSRRWRKYGHRFLRKTSPLSACSIVAHQPTSAAHGPDRSSPELNIQKTDWYLFIHRQKGREIYILLFERDEHPESQSVIVSTSRLDPPGKTQLERKRCCSLRFNVHGILYVEDENGHIAPVEHEIRQLAAGLQGIKDEQEYIVVRERVHRDSKHGS